MTTHNRVPKWRIIELQIRAAIAKQPDLTVAELKATLGTEYCVETLCDALHAIKLTMFRPVARTVPAMQSSARPPIVAAAA